MEITTAGTRTPGAKMQFLIRRRPEVSQPDLVANWFHNHMPDVITGQLQAADAGRPHARRYIATVYDSTPDGGPPPWDGVAQLWFDDPLPRPAEPHGTAPRDTFQQRAEPYAPWPTTEFVVVDGDLPLTPNTLNDPYPCTRSGFVKLTSLITVRDPAAQQTFLRHWHEVHAPNVAQALTAAGGLRYVLNQSLEPDIDRYVGMAEAWFPSQDSVEVFRHQLEPDGAQEMVDAVTMLMAGTEMVGIP